MYLCLAAGFLQEPLRKIMPGEPVYFTMLAALFVAVTFIGARLRGIPLVFRPIHAWSRILRIPLNLFIVVVVIQSLVTYINTDSLVMSGIGLIGYLSPLPTLLLAYYFAWDKEDVVKFLTWYIVLCTLMISGIYLSRMGFDWKVLKSVGTALRIYTKTRTGYIDLPSGFFRAPEVAAWHGGAAICMLIILAVGKKNKRLIWLAGIAIPFILVAVIFTGRAKVLLEIGMFVLIFWWLLRYFRRGGTTLATMILLFGLTGWLFASQTDFGSNLLSTDISPYMGRHVSSRQSPIDRLLNMTVYSFDTIVEANGFFGSGAGTGSQGAQHFGGGSTLVGGSAEGGLGKVLAELGVPGLALFLVMLYRLVRYLWRILKSSQGGDPQLALLVYGITAFLAANALVFVTAHQVFGDPFVLLMLGWLLGFVIAAPKLEKESAKQPETGHQSVSGG
jgi:hypothetical protein